MAHKAVLVNALSRAVADRVVIQDITVGRKGLLGYLKALGGGNVVKVTPSSGSASESQAAEKRLKVICGANTSHLSDGEWIDDNTPVTICQVRVSPSNSVRPNVGAAELAETLARVMPFASREDARPVLQCVLFTAKDGKLTLVGADGYRLALESLDYDDGEGHALIHLDDLKGMVSALRRARRARISFDKNGESLEGVSLVIDTELIRYRWVSFEGSYPDYEKLVPTDCNTVAHFDTVEATRAVNSLKALSGSGKDYPIDLAIGDGRIVMANPDDKGQAELEADTDGEVKVRVHGGYLTQALKACGGMVDLKLTDNHSPMLFCANGYQLVVMPMMTPEASEQARVEREAKAEAEQVTETAEPGDTEPVTEAKPEKPRKAKRSRAKEPVAVA